MKSLRRRDRRKVCGTAFLGSCFHPHGIFVSDYIPITLCSNFFFSKEYLVRMSYIVNPNMVIQLFSLWKGLKLQPRLSSPDGSQALVSGTSHPSSSPSGLLDIVGNAVVNNHSLLLGQSQSLRTDTCLTQNNSTASTMGNLSESVQNLGMDQLVEVEDVEDMGNLEGSVNKILLGDVQTVPIRIIDSHPALSK